MMRKGNAPTRRTATVASMQSGSVRSRVDPPSDGAAKTLQAASFRQRYSMLLKRYLEDRSEEILLDVYRLGREAVVDEMGLLATTELHHDALRDVLAHEVRIGDHDEICRLAGTVLAELLSAYEMSCRGYREASTAMRHLNEMLEDEVRRIAHAIHDGAGQYLACVHISLYAIAKHVPESGKQELKHAHELLEELERDLRRVSHELRPRVLENAGLVGAVDFLVDGVTKRTGLEIHVTNTLTERPAGVIETALYRCIQELLNNIVKHAGASNVWITLEEQGDWITCEVRDDGVGFDIAEVLVNSGGRQLGFLGIQERIAVLGGKVDIDSSHGRGSHVVIRVPK